MTQNETLQIITSNTVKELFLSSLSDNDQIVDDLNKLLLYISSKDQSIDGAKVLQFAKEIGTKDKSYQQCIRLLLTILRKFNSQSLNDVKQEIISILQQVTNIPEALQRMIQNLK